MLVEFKNNSDKQTCSVTIDSVLYDWDVPYVPGKLDFRGAWLFFWCQKRRKRTEIKDFEFLKPTDNLSEIVRGFEYMKKPIFAQQAIMNFKNRI